MKKKHFKILFLGILLIGVQATILADAGINIFAYNNTSFEKQVAIRNQKGGFDYIVNIPAYRHMLIKYVSTYSNSKKTIEIKDEGKLNFTLDNGWKYNSLNVNSLSGNIGVDYMHKEWHRWHGTPGITITINPQKVKLDTSEIFNNIDRVLIFGDSLSDKGTLFEYTQGVIPNSKHYYNGMFSNSNTWAGLLENQLYESNIIEFSNYAVGGATTRFKPDGKHLPYTLAGEVDIFKLNSIKNGWRDCSNFLTFIWIGGNDYLTSPSDMPAGEQLSLVEDVIAGIKENTETLIKNHGIKKFVYISLPDLSYVPESKHDLKNSKVTKLLSLMHNTKLNNMVSELQSKYTNYVFKLIDINPVFQEYIENTEIMNYKYNTEITNLEDSCWTGGYFTKRNENDIADLDLPNTPDIANAIMINKSGHMVDNPYNYLFWDRVHPTQQVHRVINEYILSSLGVEFNKITSFKSKIYL